MDLNDISRRLEAAKGDPNALALATIDIVLASREPAFTAALEAAAIPHWFDEPMLRDLLGDVLPSAPDWFDQLVGLTVVERFHARDAWNVHEVTRLALRNRLAGEQPGRFRALGKHAASLFEGDAWSHSIERVYHLLSSEPEQGADDLRRLWKAWSTAGKLQPLQALGKSLDELCSRDLLTPKARAYALVALGVIRENRIGLGEWESTARASVELMTNMGDEVGLVDGYTLLGNILRAKGRLAEALSAYEEARTHCDRVASGQSNGADLADLADLRANVHEGVGRTLKDRGLLREALAEFEAVMKIREDLCDGDPENHQKRGQLAIAHADVGDALEKTSRSDEAEKHFVRAMSVLKALDAGELGQEAAEQNIGRLQVRLGDALQERGRLDEALKQFESTEQIAHRLTEADPEHWGWKHDVAAVHLRIGGVDLIRGQLDAAEQRLTNARAIYVDLSERDPTNPLWKNSLAALSSGFGVLRERQGRWGEAVTEHLGAERLARELSEADPDRAEWRSMLAAIQNGLGSCIKKVVEALEGDEQKAKLLLLMVQKFAGAKDTLAELVQRDPDNIPWQSGLAWSQRLFAGATETVANSLDSGLKLDVEVSTVALRESALAGYFSSIDILTKLVAQAPDNTDFKRDLTIAATGSSNVLETLGRRDEALLGYRAALTVIRTLTLVDATNPLWAGDLALVERAITRLEGREAASGTQDTSP